jgi:hypothetical protein
VGLLKEAKVEQAAAKLGLFGKQGTGKTTTAAMLAIGLAKAYHAGAPVAFFDTENGSDYLVPIFAAEGVKLLVIKSRAFADMQAGLKEAKQAGACAYIVDSYTHPWAELCDTFKAKSKRKRLEFHHMDQLKGMWRIWTDEMLNSPLHVLLCGRLGYEWGEEQDDDGGKNLVKLGTKMKTESEAGYEPSLLLELEAIQPASVNASRKAKRGAIMHRINVLKDRWRTLNGRSFEFADLNHYAPGAYEVVFKTFLPHFSQLAIGTSTQRAIEGDRTSANLFGEGGESMGAQMQRRREIAAEEIAGILRHTWPGETANDKKIRQSLLHVLFDTFSWKSIENRHPNELEEAAILLRLLVETLAASEKPPADPESLSELLRFTVAEHKRTTTAPPLPVADAVEQSEEAPVF